MIILPGVRAKVARVPFVFRAADCMDESGMFGRSYGRRVAAVLARPVVKRIVDQNGRVFTVPVGGAPLGKFGGETAALFEPVGTNLVIHGRAFNSWGLQSGATVTANTLAAPDGRVLADTITGGGADESGVHITPTYTADGTKAFLAVVKNLSSTHTDILIYDTIVPITRVRIRITWNGSVPTPAIASGAGTLYPTEALGDGFYAFAFTADGIVAANATRFYIYPHDNSPYTGSIYGAFAQAENAPVPSSLMVTSGGTFTKTADGCYFEVPGLNPPRPMTMYVRGRNRGLTPGHSQSLKFVHIGSTSSGADPRLGLQYTNTAAVQGYYDDGVTASFVGTGCNVQRGDVLEAIVTLDASFAHRASNAINGVQSAISGPGVSGPSTAWAAPFVNLAGYTDHGALAYTHVVVAEGVRTMDEMRELANL